MRQRPQGFIYEHALQRLDPTRPVQRGLALITANTDQAAFGLLGIDGVNDLALDVLAKEEVP